MCAFSKKSIILQFESTVSEAFFRKKYSLRNERMNSGFKDETFWYNRCNTLKHISLKSSIDRILRIFNSLHNDTNEEHVNLKYNGDGDGTDSVSGSIWFGNKGSEVRIYIVNKITEMIIIAANNEKCKRRSHAFLDIFALLSNQSQCFIEAPNQKYFNFLLC